MSKLTYTDTERLVQLVIVIIKVSKDSLFESRT